MFVYSGLVAWTYFSSSLGAAATTLVDDEALVTKIYFPRLLAPLAAALPPLLDLGVSLLILGCILAWAGAGLSLALLSAPLWIFALTLFTAGVGAFLSALTVQYRDVRHALTFVVQTWLFASPVVYPASLVEGPLLYAYAVNPMVGILEGFRWSLAGGPAPGPEALVSLAVGATAALLGVLYFQAIERRFADVI